MVDVDEATVRSIVDTLRRQAAALEAQLPTRHHVNPDKNNGEFDPLRDTPPVAPVKDNKQPGYTDPIQVSWSGFLLWGGLYAVNIREGRYATESECREIARAAGYHGNGAWTGTRDWKAGTHRDSQGGRMITERGKQWLTDYMAEVGQELPGDLPDPTA